MNFIYSVIYTVSKGFNCQYSFHKNFNTRDSAQAFIKELRLLPVYEDSYGNVYNYKDDDGNKYYLEIGDIIKHP